MHFIIQLLDCILIDRVLCSTPLKFLKLLDKYNTFIDTSLMGFFSDNTYKKYYGILKYTSPYYLKMSDLPYVASVLPWGEVSLF